MTQTLDDIVVEMIQHCRARCGSGFGNYPLGMRDAIRMLLPLVDLDIRRSPTGMTVTELLADLDARLAE